MNAANLRALIETLVAIPGPSGHEGAMAAAMASRMTAFSPDVTCDALGNITARFAPADAGQIAPHIAVLAHMDTVGFQVKSVDPAGFLRVLAKGAARDPQNRFESADTFADALHEQAKSGKPSMIDRWLKAVSKGKRA